MEHKTHRFLPIMKRGRGVDEGGSAERGDISFNPPGCFSDMSDGQRERSKLSEDLKKLVLNEQRARKSQKRVFVR